MTSHRRQIWAACSSASITLALMSLAASSAQAECGDYVRIGSNSMKSSHPLPTHPHQSPTCRTHDSAPLVPPAPAPIPTSDLFCAIEQVGAPPVSRIDRLQISSFKITTEFASEIFHPPKLLPG